MSVDPIVGKNDHSILPVSCAVFLCTGNTCRSPMAQFLMQKELEKRQKMASGKFLRDCRVFSAGLFVLKSSPAHLLTKAVLARRCLSLNNFRSQSLDPKLFPDAHYFCMTEAHQRQLLSKFPSLRPVTFLVREFLDGTDIIDPFNQSIAVYEKVCRMIEESLPSLIAHLRWDI